jgi:hypothetical protein
MRQEQTAVGGKALQDNRLEGKLERWSVSRRMQMSRWISSIQYRITISGDRMHAYAIVATSCGKVCLGGRTMPACCFSKHVHVAGSVRSLSADYTYYNCADY